MEQTSPTATPLLAVDDLRITFPSARGDVQAVRGVSFHVAGGEAVALVGESGSGKSVTAGAVMGIVDKPGVVVGGGVRWRGKPMLGSREAARYARSVRGRDIAMVFQDPMTSLDPLATIGSQLIESIRTHMGLGRAQARALALEYLELVGISSPQRRLTQFPHELSGGMRQRVLIAQAVSCNPAMLVADEPTTALDVTIQAQVLDVIDRLRRELGLALLLITHDLGVVAETCERVQVMYGGKLVETAPTRRFFSHPEHPYSASLLASTPSLDDDVDRLIAIPGAPPDMARPPAGCAFQPRCPVALDRCVDEQPDPVVVAGRSVSCWLPSTIAAHEGLAGHV